MGGYDFSDQQDSGPPPMKESSDPTTEVPLGSPCTSEGSCSSDDDCASCASAADGVAAKQGGFDNPAFRKDSLEDLKKKQKQKEEEDIWNVVPPHIDTGPKWEDMSTGHQILRVVVNCLKILAVFTLLYFFICSLDMLSSAFKLIAGKTTGEVANNKLVKNPIVGLMVGILLTVLVQSSSTSTSIIVSMVSAQILEVHDAIPMIMGTNIGTSVTNTIVSLTQIGDRAVFRRAFAGATVHDMFNWLAVIVLLIVELISGLLEKITGSLLDTIDFGEGGEVKILKYITEPFTNLIVLLDTNVLGCWGLGYMLEKDSMIVEFCKFTPSENDTTTPEVSFSTEAPNVNVTPARCLDDLSTVGVPDTCNFLFYDTGMTDSQVGIIMLILSLLILCTALIVIVKILNSLLKGSIALVIKKTLNADIPYVPWLTGYIAILIGAVMTFIVQSSSIFTSTLTPLIGIGIITVDRAYPLTLGSNIGTTTTALLASLAGEGAGLENAIQIALVHLFFNIFGILLFYPIPFMRFPLPMCKFLGDVTSRYRWFAVIYLIFMFFLMPMSVFALSLGGQIVLYCVLGPVFALLAFVMLINLIQSKKPSILPTVLQTWDFLPEPLRSLAPYDKTMTKLPCCKRCRDDVSELEEVIPVPVDGGATKRSITEKNGIDNPAMITPM